MVELMIVACLATEPGLCRTETQALPEMTLNQCSLGSQIIAAAWVGRNPGWRVRMLRCTIHDRSEAAI